MCPETDNTGVADHEEDSGGSRRSGTRSQANPGASASAIIGSRSEEDPAHLHAEMARDPVADSDRAEPTSTGGAGGEFPLATSPRSMGVADQPPDRATAAGSSPRALMRTSTRVESSGDTRPTSAGESIPRPILSGEETARDPVAAGRVQDTGSSVDASSAAQIIPRRHTWSQSGITKEKEYKDDTIRYDKNVLFSLLLVNQLILLMLLLTKIGKKLWIVSMMHL